MVAKMENQSLTDGSWKEKARISPRTYRQKTENREKSTKPNLDSLGKKLTTSAFKLLKSEMEVGTSSLTLQK